VPWTYTKLIVQNGWVAGIYSQEGDGGGADVVAMLVRISDGRTLRSELPEPWEWSPGIYPAEKEFWGLVTTSPSADRLGDHGPHAVFGDASRSRRGAVTA
jgi:hypothetical protein